MNPKAETMKLTAKIVRVVSIIFLIQMISCENKQNRDLDNQQSDQPKLISTLHLLNLPNFENIKPIGLDDPVIIVNDTIDIGNSQLNPVQILPEFDASIFDYNINGRLTPQEPYLNANAFIEVHNGNYLTGENKVDCKCSSSAGVTFIKLRMNADINKIYVLTIQAEARTSEARVTIFSSGLLHNAMLNDDNSEFEVLFSSLENGFVDFWMQCSSPNTYSTPWVFKAIEIQEVDRP